MRLIYPTDTFNPKIVDEVYEDEFSTAQEMGLATSLFNFEDFQNDQRFRPRPMIEAGDEVLFRCWMMPPEAYERLHDATVAQGGVPVTKPSDYRLCHHLPEWYPLLREQTAETRFYAESDDLVSDLTVAGWNGCFLKDYVKSLSTDGGSVVRDLSLIPSVIAKMRKYRGVIEGGLWARRLEDYDPTSEKRYFVWRGKAHAHEGDVPEIVHEGAKRVSSLFFTVDVARRSDGVLSIVELGDGQVSDRKQWTSRQLLEILAGSQRTECIV